MAEKRYSLVVVLLAVAVAAGIAVISLGGGLFLGYQWGKSAGKAQTLAELPETAVQALGPLLEEFLPRGDLRRGGLDQLIPPGNRGELPFLSQTYLGVTFRVITPELQEEENLDVERGALIIEVQQHSPADEAGLRQGDIVLAVDGARVDQDHPLDARIGNYEPGERVELTIVRNGRRIPIEVELGARPRGSSLGGNFLGRFFGELGPGFQFQGELPEGFRFDFRCGDEPCRFLDGLEGFEG